MKKTFVDIGLGFIVYIVLYITMLPIACLFRDPFSGAGAGESLNYEYLIASIPALLITIVITWISRTKLRSDAFRKSIIWTIMVLIIDIVFAIINAVDLGEFSLSTFDKTFNDSLGQFGYYVLLAAIFVGPLLYSKIKHLE